MSARRTNAGGWVRKAENDLLNIRNNLRASRVPWDTVCFHAQQAAEKYLKAFCILHERPLQRTHDLVLLLEECAEIEPRLFDLIGECELLSKHAVDARYPGETGSPDPDQGREAVLAARRVRQAFRRAMLLPGSRPGGKHARIRRRGKAKA